MTQLERTDLHAAIETRYPDNTTEDITPLRLRQGLHELVDSVFVTATDTGAVPNVPLYQAGTTYVVGATVRFTPGSGLEAFYYALKVGKLPAPVAVADPNWKIVPGPVPVTQLGQTITLAQARNINGDTVVLGRDYAIELPLPSASGHAQVLSVAGIAENWLASEGYLVVNNVRTRIENIDYVAGTWQLAVSGSQLAAVRDTLPLRPTRTASASLKLEDIGSLVPVASANAVTLTIPLGLGLAAPAGSQLGAARVCYPLQMGDGLLSVAPATGVTVSTPPGAGLNSPGKNGRLNLIWLDVNTVLVEGGVV